MIFWKIQRMIKKLVRRMTPKTAIDELLEGSVKEQIMARNAIICFQEAEISRLRHAREQE